MALVLTRSLTTIIISLAFLLLLISNSSLFPIPYCATIYLVIPALLLVSTLLLHITFLRPDNINNETNKKKKDEQKKKKGTPPGPLSLPILGNWLQVGNDLNHRYLARLSQAYYGPIFQLKLGSRNLVVVSDPDLATQVLHTQGVQFGSRPRNVVFDIFTGNGQDMVFTTYGEHWRKMRRIMTVPFFTTKVVQNYRSMWQEEMDLVVDDLSSINMNNRDDDDDDDDDDVVIIRRRLQLMLYNIMYRMMFGPTARFESASDPLFLEATRFNSERSRLAQSFDYNYGDFIPILRPFLRGYLNNCRDLQKRRLAFFNNHYVDNRR